MNKFTIPTILIATVLVAGIFALMPIDKASTTHTTMQGSQLNEAGAVDIDMFSDNLNSDFITITSTGDFIVFCQITDVGEGGTLTIADDGDPGATNGFDMGQDDPLAIQWAADADDTVTLSADSSFDALCTALTTTDGEITFG